MRCLFAERKIGHSVLSCDKLEITSFSTLNITLNKKVGIKETTLLTLFQFKGIIISFQDCAWCTVSYCRNIGGREGFGWCPQFLKTKTILNLGLNYLRKDEHG